MTFKTKNFKISEEAWEDFIINCRRAGTNASAEIRRNVDSYNKNPPGKKIQQKQLNH